MEKKEIIEKGIEGGYTTQHHKDIVLSNAWEKEIINEFVLDPKFWQAVGIQLYKETGTVRGNEKELAKIFAKDKMLKMIDHLVEGETIESFIKSL